MGKGGHYVGEKEKVPSNSVLPTANQTTVTNVQVTVTSNVRKEKSLLDTYILSLVPIFGLFGSHHFYLGRCWFGFAYLLTCGLFGVGYVVDIFRVPYLVAEYNRKVRSGQSLTSRERTVGDTYVLWFPLGLFGAHHFFLRNYGMGFLYLFTVGLFGVGWLVDILRIPGMVDRHNEWIRTQDPEVRAKKNTCTAYAFALSPLGLVGAHHFYLNRPVWGILYANTLGLCGVGYMYDWFRLPVLVERANQQRIHDDVEQRVDFPQCNTSRKYLDDAFLLWLPPLGLFGFHHFYLRRYVWGVIYLCTCGCFGIGWLIDLCRISCLVKDCNKVADEQRSLQSYAPKYYVTPGGPTGGKTIVTVTSTGPAIYPPPGGASAFPDTLLEGFHPHGAVPQYPPQYHQLGYSGPESYEYYPSDPSRPYAPPSYTESMQSEKEQQLYPVLPTEEKISPE